jgi:hypothetical protein
VSSGVPSSVSSAAQATARQVSRGSRVRRIGNPGSGRILTARSGWGATNSADPVHGGATPVPEDGAARGPGCPRYSAISSISPMYA